MWAMNEFDLSDVETTRPNLASFPNMDDMLALYEKVLSELDSAISTQKEFASEDKSSSARHGKDFAN